MDYRLQETGVNQSELPSAEVDRIVRLAIAEDMPWGDVTSDNLIPGDQLGVGRVEARERGILAGLPVARAVFAQVDPSLQFIAHAVEGARLERGQIVAEVRGSLRSLLRGE